MDDPQAPDHSAAATPADTWAEVTAAVAAGDAVAAADALYRTGLPLALTRKLTVESEERVGGGPAVDAVAAAVSDFALAVQAGTTITNPKAWVVKVARRRLAVVVNAAKDDRERGQDERSLSALTEQELDGADAPWETAEESERQAAIRDEALAIAARLVARLPSHPRIFMEHIIDAARRGRPDVSNEELLEVARAAGLEMTMGAVRQNKKRGFDRLMALAAEDEVVEAVDTFLDGLEPAGDPDYDGG
jgi:DNA-directed RNA polymerase specialized sigma24 family protein